MLTRRLSKVIMSLGLRTQSGVCNTMEMPREVWSMCSACFGYRELVEVVRGDNRAGACRNWPLSTAPPVPAGQTHGCFGKALVPGLFCTRVGHCSQKPRYPCFMLVTSGPVVQNRSMAAALNPSCVSGASATWIVRIPLIYTVALVACLQAEF